MMTGMVRAGLFGGFADGLAEGGVSEIAGSITGALVSLAIPIGIVLFLQKRRNDKTQSDEDFDEF